MPYGREQRWDSKIVDWQDMTEFERERTMQVLTTLNQSRIANQERKLHNRCDPYACPESQAKT